MKKDDFKEYFDEAYLRLSRSCTRNIMINNVGYIYGLIDLARHAAIINENESSTLEAQVKDLFELKNYELR